jgi:predicted dinucleotide-binding enzyme
VTAIAVIGAGRVGATLGRRWRELGHDVAFGVRDPSNERARAVGGVAIVDAVAGADVVVLATPFGAVADAIAAAGDLTGKIVVDCTNPIGPDGLLVGTTSSGAEQVAAHAVGANVVKAFNTTGAENMADPQYPGGALTMLLAGDDDDAKATVAQLASDLGFDSVDLGSLETARYLEPFAMVWIMLAMRQGLGRDIGFTLQRR